LIFLLHPTTKNFGVGIKPMIELRSLKSKLIVATSCLLALVFIGQSIVNTISIERRLRDGINDEVKAFAVLSTRSLVEVYEEYYLSGFRKFKEIVEDTVKWSRGIARVRLVDMMGRVRFDTEDLTRKEIKDLETIDPFLLEEVRKLEPSYIHYKDSQGKIFSSDQPPSVINEIVYPFVDEWGRHQYSIVYSVSYETVQKEIQWDIVRAILFTLLLIAIAVNAVNFLTIKIIKPLLNLEEGARIVGGGNLDYKLEIKTEDEVGEVAREFNKMTEKLKESRKGLEEAKESLEIKVKERTKELQKRVDELERFHRVTVRREMKMIELKKEIESLKKKLEKKGRI